MKLRFAALPLLVMLTLSACDDAKDKTIAKANGVTIKQTDIDTVLSKLGIKTAFDALKEEQKQAVIKEAVVQKLVSKDIEASKIADEPETKKQLALVKAQVLQNDFLARKARAAATEEAVKVKYDELVADLKGKEEIRISQIVVKTEEEAIVIRDELRKEPGSFTQLAKEKSLDSSAANGGDIGYFLPGSLIKPVEEATVSLKKGELSKPVKTEQGWHIIKLTDRKPAEAAPFDKVKDKISQNIGQQAISAYIKAKLDSVKLDTASK